jgi:hypothetical protein
MMGTGAASSRAALSAIVADRSDAINALKLAQPISFSNTQRHRSNGESHRCH